MEEMYPGVNRTELDRLYHYDGGHLHGLAAGGVPERINLQPMLSSLNQGSTSVPSFHQLERNLIRLAEGPPARRVTLDIESIFGTGSTPEGFKVTYFVDGLRQPREYFPNKVVG
ncbi:hypothetical protein C4K88_07535 [Arthrobacter pityocampae]|uniref:Type VII secretion system protein EssD-like domain-containing protein n=1 Tax=Arthrobacter pityocampae TaxID=547334 RepID=A0A2S5IYA3_9MICC|nr:hypothetical protein C4K88_07535 [Arthrobacter pityocampae]